MPGPVTWAGQVAQGPVTWAGQVAQGPVTRAGRVTQGALLPGSAEKNKASPTFITLWLSIRPSRFPEKLFQKNLKKGLHFSKDCGIIIELSRETANTVGVDCREGPPVPIPNTEVKLAGAEDTWLVTARKNRFSPTQKRNHSQLRVVFLCLRQGKSRRELRSRVRWKRTERRPRL